MARDQRPIAADVVDVLISIHILDQAPFGFTNKQWRSPHCCKRPHRRADPAGHDLARFFKERFRVNDSTFGGFWHQLVLKSENLPPKSPRINSPPPGSHRQRTTRRSPIEREEGCRKVKNADQPNEIMLLKLFCH